MNRENEKVVHLRQDRRSAIAQQRLDEIRQIMEEVEPDPQPSAAMTAEDLDAIQYEKEFIKRFGIDWPRAQREQLIRLKLDYDLTDREIKLLYRTGCLKPGSSEIRITASRWVAAFGWAQIGWMLLIVAVALLAAWPTLAFTPERAVRVSGLLAFVACFSWAIYQVFVRPWRIQRRANWPHMRATAARTCS